MSKLELTFDAVYYHVTDIEKSIAFYRDILGFHLTSRDYVARFDLGGVLFRTCSQSSRQHAAGYWQCTVEPRGH